MVDEAFRNFVTERADSLTLRSSKGKSRLLRPRESPLATANSARARSQEIPSPAARG